MRLNEKLLNRMIVENNKEAGELIRDQRLKLGITQQDLAKRVKVSQGVISHVENGIDVTFKLNDFSKALRLNPDQILACLSH